MHCNQGVAGIPHHHHPSIPTTKPPLPPCSPGCLCPLQHHPPGTQASVTPALHFVDGAFTLAQHSSSSSDTLVLTLCQDNSERVKRKNAHDEWGCAPSPLHPGALKAMLEALAVDKVAVTVDFVKDSDGEGEDDEVTREVLSWMSDYEIEFQNLLDKARSVLREAVEKMNLPPPPPPVSAGTSAQGPAGDDDYQDPAREASVEHLPGRPNVGSTQNTDHYSTVVTLAQVERRGTDTVGDQQPPAGRVLRAVAESMKVARYTGFGLKERCAGMEDIDADLERYLRSFRRVVGRTKEARRSMPMD